jgi:hypothetical protein
MVRIAIREYEKENGITKHKNVTEGSNPTLNKRRVHFNKPTMLL